MNNPVMPVVVMLAKAPVPGFAKTRLIPTLGRQSAGIIAQKLLKHACETVTQVGQCSLHLALTPCPTSEQWQPYQDLLPIGLTDSGRAGEQQVSYSNQAEGDLGDRLIQACRDAGGEHRPVIVMGTDCPAIKPSVISDALLALDNYDALLLPVHDGGYALLAMKVFDARVFQSIRWSSAVTADDTRRQMKAIGWNWIELDPVNDIDEGDDLTHCPESWLKDLPINSVSTIN